MSLTPIIEVSYQSGSSLYAIIHRSDGLVWNNFTLAFEAYNAANWGQYAVVLAEQAGSGYYSAAYPVGIQGTLTTEVVYEVRSGSPALSDAPGISMGQSQGSNIAAIFNNQLAAQNMGAALGVEILGQAVAGLLSSTQMTTNLPDAIDSVYVGRTLYFTAGGLIRQAGRITAYLGATRMLTFTAMTGTPAIGDAFVIV